MMYNDLPEAGSSLVDLYIIKSKMPDFTGVSLTWLVKSAVLMNKPTRATTSKLDQLLWLTANFAFRGPFSQKGTVPGLDIEKSITLLTDQLIANDCTLTLPILGRLTDTSNNTFLIYQNPFEGTDYTTVEEKSFKINLTDSTVFSSLGTDILPLKEALPKIAGAPDRYAKLIKNLKKQGEYILYNLIMMYILGMTSVGMSGVYVNMKKGVFIVIAPQTGKTSSAARPSITLKEVEKPGPYFYFSGLFPKKGLPIWHKIVSDYLKTIIQKLTIKRFSNATWDNKRTIALSHISMFHMEKTAVASKTGWPMYDKLLATLDVENQPITLEPLYVGDLAIPEIYELAEEGDEQAFFILEQHRLEQRRLAAQKAGVYVRESETAGLVGGMRNVNSEIYTYSASENNDDRTFTLRNLKYALEVYIRKGEFLQSAYIATEIWRLHEIGLEEYKDLFHTLAITVVKDIGPADPTLVLNIVQDMAILYKEKAANNVVFGRILGFIKLMCDAPKSRIPSYIDFAALLYDENEVSEKELLRNFEKEYSMKKELIDSMAETTKIEYRLYLKLALYSLIHKDEGVFYWMNLCFEPQLYGSAGRLKLGPRMKTGPVAAIFSMLQQQSMPEYAVELFRQYYVRNKSYYILIYLCFMSLHNRHLGTLKDLLAQNNELKELQELRERLLKGDYKIELDAYAYLPKTRITEKRFPLWQEAMTFKEHFVDFRSKEEDKAFKRDYMTSLLAANRDLFEQLNQ